MKLWLNANPIVLETGYELGYGPNIKLAELVLAFKEDNEEVLFCFPEFDKTKDPHKAFVSKMNLEQFHSDVLWDPDHEKATRVADILHRNSNSKECKLTNEQLIKEFRNQELSTMDADLINEIQEVLYELITIYELKEYAESVKSFIFPKVKYQNTLWLMPSEIPNHLKNVMWYKLQTKEEIVMALEYTDFWFNCVIVPKGAPPENFNSCLHYTEEHGVEAEDPDGMVLYIQIKDTARFIENTLPKLRYLGHIEVLEEKNRQAEG